MTLVVEKLDDLGMPAWLATMVVGFILFWPLGLAVLAYLIWSGRMGCGHRHRGRDERGERGPGLRERFGQWGGRGGAFRTTGNRAFDEYRDETLRRLEEEARDFQGFLDRLRMARDKVEFDQFMAERRARPAGTEPPGTGQGA